MKRFLQGLGVGILAATLILTVSYYVGGRNKISDSEVISRAKKLGMIQPTEAPLFSDNKESTENAVEPNGTNPDGTPQDSAPQESGAGSEAAPQDSTPQEADTGSEAAPQGSTPQEAGTASEAVPQDSAPQEDSAGADAASQNDLSGVNEDGSVSLVITAGESATAVSQRLLELGVISDATDFDNYLRYNNFSHKLQVGTFSLSPGMNYEEITGIISKKQN